jgi:hypothetical protein
MDACIVHVAYIKSVYYDLHDDDGRFVCLYVCMYVWMRVLCMLPTLRVCTMTCMMITADSFVCMYVCVHCTCCLH